jgi:hypothetical protein
MKSTEEIGTCMELVQDYMIKKEKHKEKRWKESKMIQECKVLCEQHKIMLEECKLIW